MQLVAEVGKSGLEGQHTCPTLHVPPFAPWSKHSAHSPVTPCTRASHCCKHDMTSALHVGSELEQISVQIG